MVLVMALGVGLLVGWRLRFPDGFTPWVLLPVRGAAAWFMYRHRHRWAPAMGTAGLATTGSPMLLASRSTLSVDRVRVRMLPSQTVEDYAAVADVGLGRAAPTGG